MCVKTLEMLYRTSEETWDKFLELLAMLKALRRQNTVTWKQEQETAT